MLLPSMCLYIRGPDFIIILYFYINSNKYFIYYLYSIDIYLALIRVPLISTHSSLRQVIIMSQFHTRETLCQPHTSVTSTEIRHFDTNPSLPYIGFLGVLSLFWVFFFAEVTWQSGVTKWRVEVTDFSLLKSRTFVEVTCGSEWYLLILKIK